MNYKIVYKDNALQHFGILGMKWGVRNEETKARYARESKVLDSDIKRYGRKRAKRIARMMDKQHISRNEARRFERNRKLLGKSSAKRIEKRIKKGDKAQIAYGKEILRKVLINVGIVTVSMTALAFSNETATVINKTARTITKVSQKGYKFVDNFMKDHSMLKYKNIINDFEYTIRDHPLEIENIYRLKG